MIEINSIFLPVFRFSVVHAAIYGAKSNTWTTKKREFVLNVIKISSEVKALFLKTTSHLWSADEISTCTYFAIDVNKMMFAVDHK